MCQLYSWMVQQAEERALAPLDSRWAFALPSRARRRYVLALDVATARFGFKVAFILKCDACVFTLDCVVSVRREIDHHQPSAPWRYTLCPQLCLRNRMSPYCATTIQGYRLQEYLERRISKTRPQCKCDCCVDNITETPIAAPAPDDVKDTIIKGHLRIERANVRQADLATNCCIAREREPA
jgi:hypothetical protein